MKKKHKFLLNTLLIILSLVAQYVAAQNSSEAIAVLKKLHSKLEKIKRVQYDNSRELHYFSEEYHSSTSGTTYLELNKTNNKAGFKYQADDVRFKDIFNGAEQFNMNKRDTTLDINYKPTREYFQSKSFLYNSPVTLLYAIPSLIEDTQTAKSLKDTLLNNKTFYLVRLMMKNKALTGLGDVEEFNIKRNIFYSIVIDKKTFLPAHIIQTNNDNPKDYTITSFKNYNLDPPKPAEYSWFYSTYAGQYTQKEELQLIAVNTMAPLWKLPLVDKSDVINLEDLKGKVVLLEFSIKNCGPCIEAVPELNSLRKNNKNKLFELISINSIDPLQDVLYFVKRWKVEYTTVYNGEATAKLYGVSSYPTTILLDKTGKVIYAGGFDKAKIDSLINENL